MWPFNLSVRLLIVDLVSRYLTNYLIRREPISERYNLWHFRNATVMLHAVLAAVSSCYSTLQGRLLTRYSPVRHCSGTEVPSPFDLNVLCTPPAFILSQDQTLESFYLYSVQVLLVRSPNQFIRVAYLSFSFTFFELYLLENSWITSLALFVLCTHSLLFNFQWPVVFLSRRSHSDFVIISYSQTFVNTFF